MDRAALIDLVESKHRMTISPTDPVFILATISEAISAETVGRAEAAADRVEAAARQIDASRMPMQNEQLRLAVIQGMRNHAAEAIKAANWRNVLIGVGMLVVTTSIGWAGGYFYNAATAEAQVAAAREQTIIVGDTIKTALSGPAAQTWGWLIQTNGNYILTAQNNCVDTKDGGRACNYVLWERPPTPPPVQQQQGQGQSSTQRAAR